MLNLQGSKRTKHINNYGNTIMWELNAMMAAQKYKMDSISDINGAGAKADMDGDMLAAAKQGARFAA